MEEVLKEEATARKMTREGRKTLDHEIYTRNNSS